MKKFLQPIACAYCKTVFQPKNSTAKYCSMPCRNADIKKPPISKECPACKSTFQTRWQKQVCCSQTCARAHDSARLGNGNWKGGRNKINTGYWKVLAKDHPAADKNGYVLEHRIVLEKQMGRYLHDRERVHHKNGVRDDNRLENLELWLVPNSKDPAGQRMKDLMNEFLTQPEIADRALIEAAFRRIFKL